MSTTFKNYVRDDIILETSNDKTYIINNIVSEIHLYESVFDNTMSLELLISDANDIVSNFPILCQGEESVSLSFHTKGKENTSIEFSGSVSNISKQVRQNEKTKVFKITVISFMMKRNNSILLDGYFDDEISEIVYSLVNDNIYLAGSTNKSLEYIETRNKKLWNIPKWRPIQYINTLCLHSQSLNNEYGYVFYENNINHFFGPLEYLFKQETDLTYTLNSKSAVGSKTDYNAIQDIKFMNNKTLIEKIKDGSISANTSIIDLKHRQIKDDVFDYQSEYNLDDIINENSVPESISITPIKSDIEYSKITNNSDKSRNLSRIRQLNNTGLTITVFGNSGIKAGDMCNFLIPAAAASNKNIDYERFSSGKFMIASIKHSIINNQYYQIIDLLKPFYNTKKEI
jgi:hypothetical protein